MTGVDMSWLWLGAGIALIAGIAIGAFVAYRFLPSATGNRRLTTELEELKSAQARYRQDVEEHFAKTGELFENLTNSYRDVYEHLATGAVNLGRDSAAHPKLDLPDARRLTEAAQGVRTTQTSPQAEPTADEAVAPTDFVEERPVESAEAPAEPETKTVAEETPEGTESTLAGAQKDSGLAGEEEPEGQPRALH